MCPVFLVIQNLVQWLVQDFLNVLFWLHFIVKQNVWEALYEPSYKALNDKNYWALERNFFIEYNANQIELAFTL
jgi:hypothetical protein